MAYTIQCSQTLSPEGAAVRIKVFVEEQGFQNEFDRWDENGCAWHVLVRDGEMPIAAGRMYSEAEGEYTLGRIAVIPAYRGKHIGKLLVSALEKQAKTCGASRFSLSAQCDKSGFYQKLGYALTEDYHMDEFCPHVTMVKSLKYGYQKKTPHGFGFLNRCGVCCILPLTQQIDYVIMFLTE